MQRQIISYALILIVVLFFFVASLLITIRQNKEYQLKNFQNEDIFTAIKWLQEKDLRFYLVEKFDSLEEPYTIIKQIPKPGTFVKRGRIVQLIVSSPNQFIYMPSYVGQNIETARNNLLTLFSVNNKLPSIKVVEDYSTNEDIKVGSVLKQFPKEGEKINFEKGVAFVVNKGIEVEKIRVKKYQWKEYIKIYNELETLGIKVKTHYEQTPYDNKIGKIFKQDIKPGKIIKPGDTITFIVGIEILNDKEKTEILRFITLKTFTKTSGIEDTDNDKKKKSKKKKYKMRHVKLYVSDHIGERLVFSEKVQPEKVIDIPYKTLGSGFVEVYIDDKLYKKRIFLDWFLKCLNPPPPKKLIITSITKYPKTEKRLF